jgi:hypothetical protein
MSETRGAARPLEGPSVERKLCRDRSAARTVAALSVLWSVGNFRKPVSRKWVAFHSSAKPYTRTSDSLRERRVADKATDPKTHHHRRLVDVFFICNDVPKKLPL